MKANIKEIFDDIVTDEIGIWTQLCPNCLPKFEYLGSIDELEMYATCGVINCWNEANYYLDFSIGKYCNAK